MLSNRCYRIDSQGINCNTKAIDSIAMIHDLHILSIDAIKSGAILLTYSAAGSRLMIATISSTLQPYPHASHTGATNASMRAAVRYDASTIKPLMTYCWPTAAAHTSSICVDICCSLLASLGCDFRYPILVPSIRPELKLPRRFPKCPPWFCRSILLRPFLLSFKKVCQALGYRHACDPTIRDELEQR